MPKPKGGRLGRGIDALIPNTGGAASSGSYGPEENAPAQATKEVVKEVVKEIVKEVPAETLLKISQIEPNRNQPRKEFNQEALNELAASIKEHGLIQPIIVQKKDGYYEIVAGERRWRAAKIAGIKKIPVVIKEYTPKEIMEIALIENIQREDLNPIEEASAYKNLMTEYNLTQDEVAKKVSKSRSTVTNSMRLLKLGDAVREMLISGEISGGHARALLAVENTDVQYELAKKISANGLSVRETERLVKSLVNPTAKKPLQANPQEDALYAAIEERLRTLIGNKVSINKKSGGRGKIEIDYYSQDDLERIIDLFNSIQ